MASLTVTIAPAAGVSVPANAGPFFVDAVFTRALPSAGGAIRDLPTSIQDTVRASLDAQLRGVFVLSDLQPSSSIDFAFLAASGSTRLKKTVSAGTGNSLSVSLSAADVAIVAAADPQPAPSPPQAYRQAYFVAVSDTPVAFDASKLQIAPVQVGGGGWTRLGLDKAFHADMPRTTSVPWLPDFLGLTSSLTWTEFHVGVDGQFTFSVPAKSSDAWMWWLSGPSPAIGIVLDDLSVPRVVRKAVALPPAVSVPATDTEPTRVPPVFTETEVANNPNVYTEDPGSFCQPFKNPERVLGERSFFVIFRAEQPVISAEASVKKDPLGVLTSTVSPPIRAMEALSPAATPRRGRAVDRNVAAAASAASVVSSGALIAGSKESSFVRHTLPSAYLDVLGSFDRGRTEMDAAHPVQWESDTSRYQATTVARGHIIEIRMRWRSNGYSLGTVAKSLTLAPRQARRIEKIEWRRSELSRRQESTQLADQVSDSVNQERAYDDSVSANLSEWERGKSSSTMASFAGGMGFVYAGFIAGGGHGASYASSSSSQEGGRATSASEEQRVRDSVRRYGDSLRKLDSLVVNEVSQEESVTGTTEVVRNANYGHSLTVIYYQILRHLKIETGVAGVRECLFVPFAISPFTVARAYRWRESIRNALRDAQYADAIKYLKDVLTNFTTSNVPAGRRSDQPVRFIHGSVFIRIAIDRPHNKDDGGFDVTSWLPLQPFLLTPALGIFSMLHAVDEAQRDALFQRQHAPGIAANWVNTLLMKVGSAGVPADFTLATRYQFNGTVRVDFTAVIPASTLITRETLTSIQFTATKPLPPGSVANLESLSFTYQTDHFQRTVATSEGAEDLILPETGVVDGAGAVLSSIPDEWERQDVRAEMILAVQSLVEHLNEHVEYYHKAIWWSMDRDRLFMLIDGFYTPGTSQVSIASVVERDPIAIIGNAIVFRVSAGSFLGLGSIKTPADLYNYYVSKEAPTEPMLISLPTDGLYAQTVMDDCPALEEHYGNTDWVLNDPDLALGDIAPELLASRRAEPQATTPSQLPQTLINLQNAPALPAPSGLAGALSAVSNPNAFRDMAGLAGTQANAATAFQTAADLAKNFGNQAAALKLAELAKDSHSTQTADQKLATVQRAADKKLVGPELAQDHANKILDSLHAPDAASPGDQRDAAVTHAILAASDSGEPFSLEHATADGTTTVSLANAGGGGGGGGSGVVSGGGSPTSLVAPFPPAIVLSRDMFDTGVIDCVEAAFQPADLVGLCGGLVDLTGDPTLPPYAGHNDTDMLFVGSLAKTYAMYVAFELRRRVTQHAKDEIKLGISPTTAPGVAKIFADLKTTWQPQLDHAFALPHGFPDLAQIFTLDPDGQARFTLADPPIDIFQIGEFGKVPAEAKFLDWMKLMMGFSNDEAAGNCIRALSFPYINGVLGSAGFFDKTTSKGLWLSGDYGIHDWIPDAPGQPPNQAGQPLTNRWALSQGRTKSNFTGTVFQLCRLFSALAQGALVDSGSSAEMIDDIMGVPFMRKALADAHPKRSVTTIHGKVGIGDEKPHHSLHDGAIVTLDRPGKSTLQFVTVVTWLIRYCQAE